jgi:hypothetical protein
VLLVIPLAAWAAVAWIALPLMGTEGPHTLGVMELFTGEQTSRGAGLGPSSEMGSPGIANSQTDREAQMERGGNRARLHAPSWPTVGVESRHGRAQL